MAGALAGAICPSLEGQRGQCVWQEGAGMQACAAAERGQVGDMQCGMKRIFFVAHGPDWEEVLA